MVLVEAAHHLDQESVQVVPDQHISAYIMERPLILQVEMEEMLIALLLINLRQVALLDLL